MVKAKRKQTKRPVKRSTKTPQTHRLSRRLATLALTIVAVIGIGVVGLKKTALSQDFTRQSLSTGDNLTQIEQQVQQVAGDGLTDIPGVSTLISRSITTDTTKALINAAVTDVYTNTTTAIDYTQLDQAVTQALSGSNTGIGAGLVSSITSAILASLHDYLGRELHSATQDLRLHLQTFQTRVQQAEMPLIIAAAVIASWLLLASGSFRRWLNGLGWAGLWSGIIGLVVTQGGLQSHKLETLTAQADAMAPVARGYLADVVNHMSGYYLIAGGVGIVLLVLTATLLKPKNA